MPPAAQSSDTQQLKSAVEHFKTTGQVDFAAVTAAKEKFFPSIGLGTDETKDLGPVEVMVKLQDILEKGPLPSPEQAPVQPPTLPVQPAPTQSASAAPLDLKAEMENMTRELTAQIDEEIKKQIAGQKSFDGAQNHFNQLVKEAEPHLEKPAAPKLTAEKVQNYNLNPLQASTDSALQNLHVGDRIDGWNLKRTFSTNFGGSPTAFYELQNDSGAMWTLNEEEIKDLIEREMAAKGKTGSPNLPSLQPEVKLPQATDFIDKNSKDVQIPTQEPIKNAPPAQAVAEVVPIPAPPVPQPVKTVEPTQVVVEPTNDQTDLNDKQKDFIKKLSKDKKDWQVFTSFTPTLWQTFWDAYKNGNLNEIGLGRDIFTHQLADTDNFTTVTIAKGDTINKLLENAGFKEQPTPSLLGSHLQLNFELIKQSHQKIMDSGINVPALPQESDLYELIKKAKAIDQTAYDQIKDSLSLLPIEGHFKVLKPEIFPEVDKLI